jgi:hypothetical protein
VIRRLRRAEAAHRASELESGLAHGPSSLRLSSMPPTGARWKPLRQRPQRAPSRGLAK